MIHAPYKSPPVIIFNVTWPANQCNESFGFTTSVADDGPERPAVLISGTDTHINTPGSYTPGALILVAMVLTKKVVVRCAEFKYRSRCTHDHRTNAVQNNPFCPFIFPVSLSNYNLWLYIFWIINIFRCHFLT